MLKAHKIMRDIVKLNGKLRKCQDKCKHINKDCVSKGNTGNWDQNNIYWEDCYCPTCLKHWTIEE